MSQAVSYRRAAEAVQPLCGEAGIRRWCIEFRQHRCFGKGR
jgi:hypothetical protein